MARKRLMPEHVYLPTKGVNPDGNGIHIRPEECVNSTNLRFSSQKLSVREGSRQLATATPSGDPILHFHTFKKPNGSEVLYGFCKNSIHKFTPGSDGAPGAWVSAFNSTQVDNCDSTSGWASAAPDPTVALDTTNKVQGSASLKLTSTGDISADTILLKRTSISALNLSTHKNIHFYYSFATDNGVAAMPTKLNLYASTNCSGDPIESITIVLTRTGNLTDPKNFSLAQVNYTAAGSLTAVQSLSITSLGGYGGDYDDGTLHLCIDDIVSVGDISSNIEFWDTADIIDETEGVTVVAAGSKPPNPNEAEDDGASRVLFYLDKSSDIFLPLDIKTKVLVTNDFGWDHVGGTGKVIVLGVDTIEGTKDSDHSGNIVAGSFYLTTERGGTIATASTLKQTVDVGGSAADGYALLGANPEDKVVEDLSDTGSWVKESGAFQIVFTSSTTTGYVAGENIYLNYTYTKSSNIKPRFVRGFHNRLILGNIYDATDGVTEPYLPWRVMWTDIQDIDDMSALSYQDIVGSDVTPITRMEYLGYYLFIYKSESKARFRHVGGANIFASETVEKRGCKAGRTVVSFRGVHFYLGEDDIYIFDGTNSFPVTLDSSTGNHRVRDTLFKLISNAKINSHFGSKYEKHNEYWLWFTRGGFTDTTTGVEETNPSMALVFNAQLGIFYFFEFKSTTAVGYYQSTSGPTWDSLDKLWNSTGFEWESGDLSGNPRALVLAKQTSDTFLTDGTDGEDYIPYEGASFTEGTAISYKLITRDFIWGDISRKVRTTKVNFECNGSVETTVGYSLDYATDSDVFKEKEDIEIDYNSRELTYFPDATGEHIRFLFEGANPFRLRWVQPHGIVHDLPGE